MVLTATVASGQTEGDKTKDLWTRSVDVTLGDAWREKSIKVPGKGEPDVVDFFRAFAKDYPCEYHDLLTRVLDGDQEVLFNHNKPVIHIDEDSCLLQNESFSMRVFYDDERPVALGVCPHKAITTELQEAYYYRYDDKTRTLNPLAQGSDFTGGIVKRQTEFSRNKENNEVTMAHRWGRCGVENQLVWDKDRFVLKDRTRDNMKGLNKVNGAYLMLHEYLNRYEMELREPERPSFSNKRGSTYNSLPICIAIIEKHSGADFAAASAMEGHYDFRARAWHRDDGSLLVAVYAECAPQYDYDFHQKGDKGKTPHKLTAGDEVMLNFYLCDNTENIYYLDPESPRYAEIVGKDVPSLEKNEWRCVLTHKNEDLSFVNEADGREIVFRWDGRQLKKQ